MESIHVHGPCTLLAAVFMAFMAAVVHWRLAGRVTYCMELAIWGCGVCVVLVAVC